MDKLSGDSWVEKSARRDDVIPIRRTLDTRRRTDVNEFSVFIADAMPSLLPLPVTDDLFGRAIPTIQSLYVLSWVRGINGNDIDSFHSHSICQISSLMII